LRSTELRQELARPTQGRVATDNVYDA
jgi:hypothetical protein